MICWTTRPEWTQFFLNICIQQACYSHALQNGAWKIVVSNELSIFKFHVSCLGCTCCVCFCRTVPWQLSTLEEMPFTSIWPMFRHKKTRIFVLKHTSCRFDVKKGPFRKTILYPNISYDLGMIRDEWPHIFFLSCRPKLGASQQERTTLWGILQPCLELIARNEPWTSMFGRWFIALWGNSGLFSGFFHISFRECVYLSLDIIENDLASAPFFGKPNSADFVGCANTWLNQPPHPVFQCQMNERLHGSAH